MTVFSRLERIQQVADFPPADNKRRICGWIRRCCRNGREWRIRGAGEMIPSDVGQVTVALTWACTWKCLALQVDLSQECPCARLIYQQQTTVYLVLKQALCMYFLFSNSSIRKQKPRRHEPPQVQPIPRRQLIRTFPEGCFGVRQQPCPSRVSVIA